MVKNRAKVRQFVRVITRTTKRVLTNQLDVRTLTGFAAIAVAILTIAEFLVKLSTGMRPSLGDDYALVAHTTENATAILTVITIDTLLMACLIIFFAGFRQLIIQKKRDLAWITDLAFGSGLVFVATTLVGDAMDGGSALDTVNAYAADPTVIRALTEGHAILFGSIGCVLIALITATFAYTTVVSKAIPAWTGWVGYAVAVANLLAVPTVYSDTDPGNFAAAGGFGVTLLATFPFLVWVVAVGVVAFMKQEPRH